MKKLFLTTALVVISSSSYAICENSYAKATNSFKKGIPLCKGAKSIELPEQLTGKFAYKKSFNDGYTRKFDFTINKEGLVSVVECSTRGPNSYDLRFSMATGGGFSCYEEELKEKSNGDLIYKIKYKKGIESESNTIKFERTGAIKLKNSEFVPLMHFPGIASGNFYHEVTRTDSNN